MRRSSLGTALIIALIAGSCLSAAQSVDLAKPVVTVNDVPISTATYYRRMERLSDVGRLVGERFVKTTPGVLTLQQLINEALLLQIAREKGAYPSDKDVNDEYANGVKDDPESFKFLLTEGLTEEDIKNQFRIQMAEFRLQTLGVNIGDQQVEEFYKANPNTYTAPKQIALHSIAVKTTAEQDAVDKELNRGSAFDEVAKKLSQDSNAPMGGFLGLVTEENLAERVRAQVKTLKRGESTGWIESKDKKVKFFVAEVFPASLAPLTPNLRKAIRQRLMLDRGRIRNDLNAWLLDARKNARLDFNGSPFEQEIREIFKRGI
jgi:PPIC-type PPIASE domain/SurA N-terminal domain